uniref:Glycosyltransferase family 92 protein n=1 Tax=Ditylenchus dipsaci TaxID=166011 RepID=A0A915DA92_9BILA
MSVLKIYERQSIVAIEPWSLMSTNENRHFEYTLNPNAEMEWRNQAAAHTDCIDAARFIIINDLDDVLIPVLGKTYLEEFNVLSSRYTKAAAFLYYRVTVNYTLVKNFEKFSIRQQLEQTYIDTRRGDGKSVIDTSKVESTWLH